MAGQIEKKYTNEMLKEMQGWDLDRKIATSLTRIIEFAKHFNNQVYVSFSGGKDSTVLLDLVRKVIPDVTVVFSNTGLEYPEIQAFARNQGAEFVRPKMMFNEVITKYGYPIISKEVSQAIYYARRIIPRERERERDSAQRLSTYAIGDLSQMWIKGYKETFRRRCDLVGLPRKFEGRFSEDEYG